MLPLCGYDVKLPSNEVGEYYDRLLKETVGWGMEGFQKDSSPVELSTGCNVVCFAWIVSLHRCTAHRAMWRRGYHPSDRVSR